MNLEKVSHKLVKVKTKTVSFDITELDNGNITISTNERWTTPSETHAGKYSVLISPRTS